MESITKNRQPEETLRAMAARAYGPGQVPAAGEDWVCELRHGWFNVAYLMRLRDGSRVVLKIAPPSGVEVLTYERDAMATGLKAALRYATRWQSRMIKPAPLQPMPKSLRRGRRGK